MTDSILFDEWHERYAAFIEDQAEERIIRKMAKVMYPRPWGRCSEGISVHSSLEYAREAVKSVRHLLRLL